MYSTTLSLTSTLAWVGGQRHAPATLPSRNRPSNLFDRRLWTPEPVSTGVEYRAFSEIRSPNSPARNESLYRLRSTDQYNVFPQIWKPKKA